MDLRNRVALFVGGLALAAVLASAAGAQSAPGRIVQAGDGTVYVLRDGARYVLVAEPIGDDELAVYADGGEIGGAQLLAGAAVAVTAPAAPAPPVAAPADEETTPAAVPGQAAPQAAPAPAQPARVVPTGAAKATANGTPPPAGGTPATGLQFVSVQGNNPGQMASVRVQATPGASCSLSYVADVRTRGGAPATGVGQQTADASGVVTWSFLINANTPPGAGAVSVTCGTATITSPIGSGLTK